MIRLARPYSGANLAAGALAGLLAGWFKLGWDVTWAPRTADRIPESMAFVSAFTHVPAPVVTSLIVFFAFSILAGIAYGLLVGMFPIVAIGAGIGFGVAIWIGAHELVMPAIGLTPPTWQLPVNEQASEFFGHALWGLVIGVFFHDLHGRLIGSKPKVHDQRAVTVPVAESVAVFSFTWFTSNAR